MSTLAGKEVHLDEGPTAGFATEALCGIVAGVLTILGLIQVVPNFMLSIAGIAIGVALLSEGATITKQYSRLLSATSEGKLNAPELGGGINVEILAGIAGIVLGILSLVGLVPIILMPIAVIGFGISLILSSGTIVRLSVLRFSISGAHESAQKIAQEVASASVGSQTLVGLSAIVSGILSLVGVEPMVITLVALLALGILILMNSIELSSKIHAMFGS